MFTTEGLNNSTNELPYFDSKFSVKLNTIEFHHNSNIVIHFLCKFLETNNINYTFESSKGLFICKISHDGILIDMNIQVFETDDENVTQVEFFRLSGDRLLFCYLVKELKQLRQIEDIQQILVSNYSETNKYLPGNLVI